MFVEYTVNVFVTKKKSVGLVYCTYYKAKFTIRYDSNFGLKCSDKHHTHRYTQFLYVRIPNDLLLQRLKLSYICYLQNLLKIIDANWESPNHILQLIYLLCLQSCNRILSSYTISNIITFLGTVRCENHSSSVCYAKNVLIFL